MTDIELTDDSDIRDNYCNFTLTNWEFKDGTILKCFNHSPSHVWKLTKIISGFLMEIQNEIHN